MDRVPPPSLSGRQILIIEGEAPLLNRLMKALEDQGAEVIYVTDPYGEAGAKRIGAFVYSAAAINALHRGFAKSLSVPVLIYGEDTEVPAVSDKIVKALKAMLA